MKDSNIPPELYNSDDQKPHKYCRGCEKELLESESDYFIEKVVKKVPELETEQVLFEFALCEECIAKMRDAISEESKASMERFMLEKLQERTQSGIADPYESFAKKECALTGQSEDELTEYQMIARCHGSQLSPMQPPMLISASAMEGMQELLSKQTRDELDRFTGENFGWPPELAKHLGSGDLVLV